MSGNLGSLANTDTKKLKKLLVDLKYSVQASESIYIMPILDHLSDNLNLVFDSVCG
jgi:SET domain-containing protein